MSLSLITDRTSTDASRYSEIRAKIKARTATTDEWVEWLTELKGAYNDGDLNRAGNAIDTITEILLNCGVLVITVSKTDWGISDTPVNIQMATYLNNLTILKAGFQELLDAYQATSQFVIPDTPSNMVSITLTIANDIEKILVNIEKQINYMDSAMYWFCSGDLYAGEV